MRRIRLGSVEILGYVGIIIWIAVMLLRENGLSGSGIYLRFIYVLPNLAAAWAFTLFGKWIVIFAFKRKLTIKTHLALCAGVFALALISEVIHHFFLDSQFDPYDIIITLAAQILIFLIPVVTKDRYFSDYT